MLTIGYKISIFVPLLSYRLVCECKLNYSYRYYVKLR